MKNKTYYPNNGDPYYYWSITHDKVCKDTWSDRGGQHYTRFGSVGVYRRAEEANDIGCQRAIEILNRFEEGRKC